jgi:hypothetical protein
LLHPVLDDYLISFPVRFKSRHYCDQGDWVSFAIHNCRQVDWLGLLARSRLSRQRLCQETQVDDKLHRDTTVRPDTPANAPILSVALEGCETLAPSHRRPRKIISGCLCSRWLGSGYFFLKIARSPGERPNSRSRLSSILMSHARQRCLAGSSLARRSLCKKLDFGTGAGTPSFRVKPSSVTFMSMV